MTEKINLYYCNSIYKYKPIQDINPLILQKHNTGRFLILCAKEQQAKRIDRLAASPESYLQDQYIVSCGWWNLKDMHFFDEEGFFLQDELSMYNVVVILDRERIHSSFFGLLKAFERTVKSTWAKDD